MTVRLLGYSFLMCALNAFLELAVPFYGVVPGFFVA